MFVFFINAFVIISHHGIYMALRICWKEWGRKKEEMNTVKSRKLDVE
jgi:hypothetical protein